MSDPFFITESYDPDQKLSAAQRKRQRMAKVAMEHHNSIIKKRIQKDSDSESMDDKPESQDEEEEVDETPAQKRLRLAKGYLELVKQEVHDIQDGEIDAAELDRELIAERLRSDVNEAAGRAFYQIADEFQVISQSDEYQRIYKGGKAGPQLPITCLAVGTLKGPMNQSSTYLYAGSKDAKIVKWDLMTGQRLHVFEGGLKPTKRLLKSVGQRQIAHDGHNDQVLCMDVSFDGTVLATGGADKMAYLWSTETNEKIASLKQHRDAVSGVKFQRGQNQLYTCSFDRTVKLWNAENHSFGHQDVITSIDALSKERCLTSGSRDRTARLWKILEESQLVFRGGGGLKITEDLIVMDDLRKGDKRTQGDNGQSGGSMDVVAMLDEDNFVTGSDTGAISLWTTMRKKPVYTKLNAHGSHSRIKCNNEDLKQTAFQEETNQNCDSTCGWITSLAALPYSDLFASGSGDGYVRLWKLSETKKSFVILNCIPAYGFVNGLSLFEAPAFKVPSTVMVKKDKKDKAVYIAFTVSQEHRLGRWWKLKKAKNQVVVLQLSQ